MKKIFKPLGILFIIVLSFVVFQMIRASLLVKTPQAYKVSVLRAFKQEKWKEVNKLTEEMLKVYPSESVFAYIYKGMAKNALGEYEESIKSFSNALDLQISAPLYQSRGFAYYNNKQYAEAIADYHKALKLNPGDELINKQLELATYARKGVVIIEDDKGKHYVSKYSPSYLADEYVNSPKAIKREYVNAVKNYSAEVKPIYYILVADDIYKKDRDLAAFLFLAGRYRSIQDAAMCENQNAYDLIDVLSVFAPNTAKYISKMKDKKQAKIYQKVLDWDEKYPERPSPEWICYHGLDVSKGDAKAKIHPLSEFPNIQMTAKDAMVKKIKLLKL